jgi:adenylate cyclase
MSGAPWLERLDTALFDALARTDRYAAEDPEVVLVDVDEASLAAAGQWPWPRYRLAAMVKTLAAAGPRAIVVDFFFPEPDRTSLSIIQDTFQCEFGLDLSFEGVPRTMTDNDGYFGYVLSNTPSVGACVLSEGPETVAPACRISRLPIQGDSERLDLVEYKGLLCNTPKIQSSYARCGFINAHKDRDGILRRLPLFAQYEGQWQPGISLAAFLVAHPHASLEIGGDFWGPLLHLDDLTIPIDRKGRVLLRFGRLLDMIPVLRAMDVLTQRFDPDIVRDRIVLIGSSATGLGDLHHTATASGIPGVAAHAALLENILSATHYRQPQWNRSYALLAIALCSGVVIGAFLLAGTIPTAVAAGIGLALFPALTILGFTFLRVFLPSAAPVGAGLSLLLFLSMSFYTVEKRLGRIREARLALFKQAMLELMVGLAETRDLETGEHIKRTQLLVRILAQGLAASGRYPGLDDYYIELLHVCAPLHDVGKIAIPDRILCKPGPLDKKEFAVMQQHVMYGQRIIEQLSRKVQGEEILTIGLEMVSTHHEKWDGTGYPAGLAGNKIPLPGRIMALADVYDALTSERVYKKRIPHAEARVIILRGSGTHFDPEVVRAFLIQEETILEHLKSYNHPEAVIIPPAQDTKGQ